MATTTSVEDRDRLGDDRGLEAHGIQVLVLEGFDRFSGEVYLLPAALSDPHQQEWKLVYWDAKGVVFMRHPPAGVPPTSRMRQRSTARKTFIMSASVHHRCWRRQVSVTSARAALFKRASM